MDLRAGTVCPSGGFSAPFPFMKFMNAVGNGCATHEILRVVVCFSREISGLVNIVLWN